MPDNNKSETVELRHEHSGNGFFTNFATVIAALEAAQIAVWSFDIDANTLAWSSNLESVHGVPAGSFDGSLARFIANIHRDDQAIVEAALGELRRTRSAFRIRYRTPHMDGRDERWIEAAATFAAENSGPQTMYGLCYDVTGRVSLENELRSRARQQEALAQLGERALAEPDLERLLNDAVSTVALTLGGRLRQDSGTASRRRRTSVARRFRLEVGSGRHGVDDGGAEQLCALYARLRHSGCHCRVCRRSQVRGPAIFEGPQLRERHERDHRRPRRPRLWHSRRLRRKKTAFHARKRPCS